MDKQDVIRFFDQAAATWDADMICSMPVVDKILDGARLRREMEVLDVACGTTIPVRRFRSLWTCRSRRSWQSSLPRGSRSSRPCPTAICIRLRAYADNNRKTHH